MKKPKAFDHAMPQIFVNKKFIRESGNEMSTIKASPPRAYFFHIWNEVAMNIDAKLSVSFKRDYQPLNSCESWLWQSTLKKIRH